MSLSKSILGKGKFLSTFRWRFLKKKLNDEILPAGAAVPWLRSMPKEVKKKIGWSTISKDEHLFFEGAFPTKFTLQWIHCFFVLKENRLLFLFGFSVHTCLFHFQVKMLHPALFCPSSTSPKELRLRNRVTPSRCIQSQPCQPLVKQKSP